MKQFIIAQSKKEFYTSHSGLAMVGLCLNKLCSLPTKAMDCFPRKAGGIGLDDILSSYVGLLTVGKSDFEAITDCRDDDHFSQSLGVARVPSAETLRQRLNEVAPALRRLADSCSVGFLKKARVTITALDTGHIPLDCNVFGMDNSKTQKKESPGYTMDETDMRPWRRTWARRAGAWSWNCVKAANTARRGSSLLLSGSSRKPAALPPEKSCLDAPRGATMRWIHALPRAIAQNFPKV